MWLYVCSNLVVDGCRLRDTLADGINFCVDTRNSVVQNCTTRTLAMIVLPCGRRHPIKVSFNRHLRPGPTFFATARANCRSSQTAGRSMVARTTVLRTAFLQIFPRLRHPDQHDFSDADESGKVDNNFSGRRWSGIAIWSAAADSTTIGPGGRLPALYGSPQHSGVEISNVNIKDSMSDGFSIVAPGSKKGQGTLSNVRLENVNIPTMDSEQTRGMVCGSATMPVRRDHP